LLVDSEFDIRGFSLGTEVSCFGISLLTTTDQKTNI